MTKPRPTPQIEAAISIAETVLAFGQVHRITRDREGRLESDTTHTVMLALLAALLHRDEAVPLDLEKLLLYALVHDLPETHAGDTPTLRALDPAARASKDAREAAARDQLRADLPFCPWLHDLLDRYEAQADPESRFIRYLDKVCPKLTHFGNACRVPIENGLSREELIEQHRQQGEKLAAQYPELTMMRRLFRVACEMSEDTYPSPKSAAGGGR